MTPWNIKKDEPPDGIFVLAAKRWEARIRRDYAESDRLRDELVALGYTIHDRKDGWDIEPIVPPNPPEKL